MNKNNRLVQATSHVLHGGQLMKRRERTIFGQSWNRRKKRVIVNSKLHFMGGDYYDRRLLMSFVKLDAHPTKGPGRGFTHPILLSDYNLATRGLVEPNGKLTPLSVDVVIESA